MLSCNTLNDFQAKQYLKLSVFNMITEINEAKTLTKQISCKCRCKFDEKNINNYKFQCQWKKHHLCEIDNVWNVATCNCENGKYLTSVMDDSAITCDEIIESYNEDTSLFER